MIKFVLMRITVCSQKMLKYSIVKERKTVKNLEVAQFYNTPIDPNSLRLRLNVRNIFTVP